MKLALLKGRCYPHPNRKEEASLNIVELAVGLKAILGLDFDWEVFDFKVDFAGQRQKSHHARTVRQLQDYQVLITMLTGLEVLPSRKPAYLGGGKKDSEYTQPYFGNLAEGWRNYPVEGIKPPKLKVAMITAEGEIILKDIDGANF